MNFNIYYKDKKFEISNSTSCSEKYFDCSSSSEVPKILQLFISDPSGTDIFVKCSRPKRAMKAIKNSLKVIEAAGGLVKNETNESLLIFRRGFWDLPKGKIEKGESKKKAAVREVIEETGVSKPKIKKFISTTYHIYEYDSVKILKISHWYLMTVKGNQTLTPQTDEDIEIAQWISNSNLHGYLSKAYNNIVEVFTKASYKS